MSDRASAKLRPLSTAGIDFSGVCPSIRQVMVLVKDKVSDEALDGALSVRKGSPSLKRSMELRYQLSLFPVCGSVSTSRCLCRIQAVYEI